MSARTEAMDVKKLIEYFQLEGSFSSVRRFGNAPVNTAYIMESLIDPTQAFLIQKINQQEHRNVELVMENQYNVTRYIHSESQLTTAQHTILPPLSGKEDKNYYRDDDGSCWRMHACPSDIKIYNTTEKPEEVYRVAKTYGWFLNVLKDYPTRCLHITVSDLHNLIVRYGGLKLDMQRPRAQSRAEVIREDIKYVTNLIHEVSRIEILRVTGGLPLRVVHNEAIPGNVLSMQNNRMTCPMNLDSVMPGLVHYDFGEGIRATMTPSEGGESGSQDVHIDLSRYKAFAEGYLEETRDVLTSAEIRHLALASVLSPFMMGIRLLTSFLLEGNQDLPDTNNNILERARLHLKLAKEFSTRLTDMEAVISGLTGTSDAV